MGIPCFLGGMARGLLGRYSDIQARQKRGEALKEADVVIMAGELSDTVRYSITLVMAGRYKQSSLDF
jgi:acetolactate synthase-like protein